MADYRTHISVSSALGVGYGAAAWWGVGFNPVHSMLAGLLTGVAGMLPDLDSDTGRPVREIFGLTATLVPMLMMERLHEWGQTHDGALLLAIMIYVGVRYGASQVLALLTVHRGMFHSVPAMFIAAELTYLAYKADNVPVKLLMSLGVAVGFLSHLILDEVYSVQWNGAVIRLKQSAGSAVKFMGKGATANILAYGLFFTLGYAVLFHGDFRIFERVAGGWSETDREPGEDEERRPSDADNSTAAPTRFASDIERPAEKPGRGHGTDNPLAAEGDDGFRDPNRVKRPAAPTLR